MLLAAVIAPTKSSVPPTISITEAARVADASTTSIPDVVTVPSPTALSVAVVVCCRCRVYVGQNGERAIDVQAFNRKCCLAGDGILAERDVARAVGMSPNGIMTLEIDKGGPSGVQRVVLFSNCRCPPVQTMSLRFATGFQPSASISAKSTAETLAYPIGNLGVVQIGGVGIRPVAAVGRSVELLQPTTPPSSVVPPLIEKEVGLKSGSGVVLLGIIFVKIKRSQE